MPSLGAGPPRLIQILPDRSYRGYLEPVADPGIEHSHIARICFADGVIRRAYVKAYHESTKGLVNEVTGHVLGACARLRVPPFAAVILVPKLAIQDAPPWITQSAEATIPCWCTSDMAAPNIKLHFSINAMSHPSHMLPVIDELRGSQDIQKVMALDDWIGNVDRNLGNLLRLAKRRYVLIDHGRILGGPAWFHLALADTLTQRDNVLRKILGPCAQTPGYRKELADIARLYHAEAAALACHELLDWWDMLLDVADMEAAAKFLDDRVLNDNICARYQVLL
jgi:hypothetical protein